MKSKQGILLATKPESKCLANVLVNNDSYAAPQDVQFGYDVRLVTN